jgi:membrane protein YqaA with SNARE-associated domain
MKIKRKSLSILLHTIVVVGIIVLAFYLAYIVRNNVLIQDIIRSYGYLGVFVVAMISGFNLAVPIPVIAFLPLFLESGLEFWTTLLLAAVGTTIADTLAFVIGGAGRHIISPSMGNKLIKKLEKIRERYQWAPLGVLFIFAMVAPFPNEILLLPLGFLGYRIIQIMPIVFVGNFIFNLLYALGATSIFKNFLQLVV